MAGDKVQVYVLPEKAAWTALLGKCLSPMACLCDAFSLLWYRQLMCFSSIRACDAFLASVPFSGWSALAAIRILCWFSIFS